MQIVKTWCVTVLVSVLAGGSAAAFSRPLAQDCLTPAEVRQMDRDFWATFPSPDGFAAYASPIPGTITVRMRYVRLRRSLSGSVFPSSIIRSI
ncbi:hypothetical protein [Burkholderia sp. BCC0405]|uniref:hypothetical protein n=1 Tax=Burkholderia sp. BCC0405 TaxID=2676298 RepID=UPI001FC83CB2|nr:hypothetical protein [Burkholderia sp. BCC0405]